MRKSTKNREPCGVDIALEDPGGVQGQSPWWGSRGAKSPEALVFFKAETAFSMQNYKHKIVKGSQLGAFCP